MGYLTIIWDMEDDPDGNVQHIADHDLTVDEVEEVLADPEGRDQPVIGATNRLRYDVYGTIHCRRLRGD